MKHHQATPESVARYPFTMCLRGSCTMICRADLVCGTKSIMQKRVKRTGRWTGWSVTEVMRKPDWLIDMHEIDVAKRKIRILRLRTGP